MESAGDHPRHGLKVTLALGKTWVTFRVLSRGRAEMSKVRINDLARELEVQSDDVLDILTELGVSAGKTHSSSLDEDYADKVRTRIEYLLRQAPAPSFSWRSPFSGHQPLCPILRKKREEEERASRSRFPQPPPAEEAGQARPTAIQTAPPDAPPIVPLEAPSASAAPAPLTSDVPTTTPRSKIRINDLARELEVRSREVLDVLTELGLGVGKTHSSSLDEYEAEKVRGRFERGPRLAGSRAQGPMRASHSRAITPEFDLSHISKPGDVLKAILAKKKEEDEARRSRLPLLHPAEKPEQARPIAIEAAQPAAPRPIVPPGAPPVAARPVDSLPVENPIRTAPRKIFPQPPPAPPVVEYPVASPAAPLRSSSGVNVVQPLVTSEKVPSPVIPASLSTVAATKHPVAKPRGPAPTPTFSSRNAQSFGRANRLEEKVVRTSQVASTTDALPPDGNDFSFMHNEQLRAVAKRDAAELKKIRAVGAHKCRLILVAAIIEALLLDALLPLKKNVEQSRAASDIKKRSNVNRELSNWSLMDLISAALELKVVSKRVRPLLTHVRLSRNLVHAGIAMNEDPIREHEARIAEDILDMVKEDLEQSAQKRRTGRNHS